METSLGRHKVVGLPPMRPVRPYRWEMQYKFGESNLRGRIEEVLPRVARPARYVGGELNSVRKTAENASIRIALAFPDVYEIGMSNLGLRILYHVLNSMDGVAAERVFAPASDMEAEMRRERIPLFSLESSLPVRDFDLVGFSLAYELSYTTALNMLDLAGIPVRSCERSDNDPIVIAGGHCVTNPEPMAEFIDAFVIGDGEEVVTEMVNAVKTIAAHCREKTRLSELHSVPRRETKLRLELLRSLAEIDGVYVPSLWSGKKIRARRVQDLESAPFPNTLIVPNIEIVHDRVALEIMRGCTRGCRFCQAGMITRPVRERSLKKLCSQAATLIENSGYEEIALTSLSSADYSGIAELVSELIDQFEPMKVGVSLPSLRADAECVNLAEEIQRVRKSGLTFAPEAGTQILRDVINKNVKEEDLLEAVEAAVEAGWRRVKLYFMVGLPTETDDDIRGIADLVRKVVDVGHKRNKLLAVNITISPFVPKPHTPFQWRGMVEPDELNRRISILKYTLKGKSITLNWHEPACSRVEAALARGDKSISQVIYEAWRRGSNLEQDRFNTSRWEAAFETVGIDIAYFANREIPIDEPLPWDHIDFGVSKNFLARENSKAERGEITPDCRWANCLGCGLECRRTGKWPVSRPGKKTKTETETRKSPLQAAAGKPSLPGPRLVCVFRKTGPARWLGHLDVVRAFERAIRMAGINVEYSQGFNPRVKMSVVSALPLGATGDGEILTLRLVGPAQPTDVARALNQKLPEGLSVTSVETLPADNKGPVVRASEFEVEVIGNHPNLSERLSKTAEELMRRESIEIERESDGRRRKIDIRPGIESVDVTPGPMDGTAKIKIVILHREFTVKPSEVINLLTNAIPGLTTKSVHRRRLILKADCR